MLVYLFFGMVNGAKINIQFVVFQATYLKSAPIFILCTEKVKQYLI